VPIYERPQPSGHVRGGVSDSRVVSRLAALDILITFGDCLGTGPPRARTQVIYADLEPGAGASRPGPQRRPSSEHGTYKTVKARFWPWLQGKNRWHCSSCSLFVRKRFCLLVTSFYPETLQRRPFIRSVLTAASCTHSLSRTRLDYVATALALVPPKPKIQKPKPKPGSRSLKPES
jgi:hypothetical protein